MTFHRPAFFALLLGSLGPSLLAGPALADARQDVLSGTQGCGGIADGRTWLECYYGAAQPMRAKLGLPAASAAQVRLVQSGPAGLAITDARQEVFSQTQRCGGIADDRTWLDCYYGAAQPMRAQLGLPAAPVAQLRLVQQGGAPAYGPQQAYAAPPAYGVPAYAAAPPAYGAPVYPAQPPAYGAPVYPSAPPAYGVPAYAAGPPAYGAPMNPGPAQPQVAAGPPPLKHNNNTGFFTSVFGGGKPIVNKVRMSNYGKDKDGHFIVTLADGEIWRINSEGDYALPRWKAPAPRLVVSIYEGALGSYNMEVSDDSQVYKVNRLN